MAFRILSILLFVIFPDVSSIDTGTEKDLRIIGGQSAKQEEFPWMVSLQRDKKGNGILTHFCAGSIVDRTTIVTAAHCVWNKLNISITVIAGSNNIVAMDEKHQQVKVEKVHVHPKYARSNRPGPNDIAVLKLKEPLTFSEYISPISLPERDEPPAPDTSCKYSGWGNRFLISGLYYYPSDTLRTTSSRVISKWSCMLRYLIIFRPQLSTALCTAAGPLRGTCQGDSGGSVTCYKDEKPYLAGVVSWGWFICGDGFHPDVATDVSMFRGYIKGFMDVKES